MDDEWEQDDSNAAIEQVLSRYPEAREFLPLINASTVDEFETVARSVAEKVRNLKTKGGTNQPSPSPRNPKPKAEKVMTVKEAVDARDWSGFLAARWTEQNERQN